MTAAVGASAVVGRTGAPRWLRKLGSAFLSVYAMAGFLYLLLPVFVIVLSAMTWAKRWRS